MRIAPASDSSIFIGFGDAISLEHNAQVVALLRRVTALAHPHIRNLHPAYASLLIDFDPLRITYEEIRDIVQGLLAKSSPFDSVSSRIVEIPVCYDSTFGPDLPFVTEHTNLNLDQVVDAHTSGRYFVYFLGFTPGFAYLGPVAPELLVPRLSTPRKHVAAGSVGLAGLQTGVYPSDSPGGWQLIGRTPFRMFEAASEPPSRLQPGDEVRFRRISREEYVQIAATERQR